jgi:hypothetical protein
MTSESSPFLERTQADPRVQEALALPEAERDALLEELVREIPSGLGLLARLAALGGDIGESALRQFCAVADRLDMEDVDELLATADPAQLRAVILALGRCECPDVLLILEERVPDVVAQYMMLVDWADERELLDLVEVLGVLRTAMALWSLDGMAGRFSGPIGERARQLLDEG